MHRDLRPLRSREKDLNNVGFSMQFAHSRTGEQVAVIALDFEAYAMKRTLTARSLTMIILTSWSILGIIPFMSANVSAADVSGTWVSAIPGEGFTAQDVLFNRHYDVRMTMSGGWSALTAEMDVRLTDVDEYRPADYPWPGPTTSDWATWYGEGTFDGTTLVLTFGWEEGNIGSTTPVFTLTVEGNEMSGGGDWYSAGVLMHGKFNLVREGFSLLSVPTITYIATSGAIIGAIAAIAVVLASTKVPMIPGVARAPPYQQSYERSIERETDPNMPFSLPEGGTTVGGVGMSYGPPAQPSGRPLPPKEHFMSVSSDPPRCPYHSDTALVAHHARADATDAGSWYCPKCRSYPWGRS